MARKFTHLDEALDRVAPAGVYVVDDLRPLPSWGAGHRQAVEDLVRGLRGRPGWLVSELDLGSGVMIATRSADGQGAHPMADGSPSGEKSR